MNRNLIHLLVDIVMFLAMLALVQTGLLMAVVLPPGSGGSTVWSLTRHSWGDVHFWTAMALLGMLLIHLVLNWGWVCTVIAKTIGRRQPASARWTRHALGSTVVLLVLLLVGSFLWVARSSVERGGRGLGRGAGHGVEAKHVGRRE